MFTRSASRLCTALLLTGSVISAAAFQTAQPAAPKPTAKPQPRPHSAKVAVDARIVQVDDGDTVVLRWPKEAEGEIVRMLGIDTPETRHVEHDIPFDQMFGPEARAFTRGVFAGATRVEVLRASTLDPYGRTLGYLFVDGRNASVLIIEARLAYESVTQFGDNGFPAEAALIKSAAEKAGPLPFEQPYQFRGRMRDVTKWMKAQGIYPTQ
jgi:endonuclease YncB( thermonuclease family)